MVNSLHPNGMVERMVDRSRRNSPLPRYGRDKEGSPKDARTLKIAGDKDRRKHPRQDDDPLRGRLIDVNA